MKASQFGAMILALFCLVPFTANAADIDDGLLQTGIVRGYAGVAQDNHRQSRHVAVAGGPAC